MKTFKQLQRIDKKLDRLIAMQSFDEHKAAKAIAEAIYSEMFKTLDRTE